MARPRTNPDERAAKISVRVLDIEQPPTGHWLVADERTGAVSAAIAGHGCQVSRWHRFAGPWCADPTPGPPEGPFDGALLRIPRTRDAYRYAVERIAAQLCPGAPLLLVGCNDEGIKNLPSDLVGVEHPDTLQTKFHARVWRLLRSESPVRTQLSGFLSPRSLELPGGKATVVGGPGLFAKSGLDPGSSMLLTALATLDDPVTTALDFACGPGVLTAGLLHRWPQAKIWATDADALATAAFAQGFPAAKVAVGDGWGAFTKLDRPSAGFDLIVSNPPLHRATNTLDLSVMDALIARSADYLAPGGRLVLVTQRQRAIARALTAAVSTPEILAEDGRFRVWSVRASG